MRELFVDFVRSPSRDTYLAVHEELTSLSVYNPYSRELDDVNQLIEQERWSDADAALNSAMPQLILTPRAHLLSAIIAENQGDEHRARMESAIAVACVDGILATGDGTESQPYTVTRTTDEYDVLSYIGKEFQRQSLCDIDGRRIDQIECTDGSAVCFDITRAFERLHHLLDEESP